MKKRLIDKNCLSPGGGRREGEREVDGQVTEKGRTELLFVTRNSKVWPALLLYETVARKIRGKIE